MYDEVILRVYKEDKLFLTLQIPSRVGSTYINNVKSDSIYEISLGFINEKGEFFEVAKYILEDTQNMIYLMKKNLELKYLMKNLKHLILKKKQDISDHQTLDLVHLI